jgi:hypothetical protein
MCEKQEVILPNSDNASPEAIAVACKLAGSGRTLIRKRRDGWKVVREGTCDIEHFESLTEVKEYMSHFNEKGRYAS